MKTITPEKSLKTIVVAGTGLPLGVMLGLLASISSRDALGFQYQFTWLTAIWFGVGIMFNRQFWKAVWRAQDVSSPRNEKSRRIFTLFFGLLGFGAFLYPLRFLQNSQYWDIGRGLATAATFLGIVGITIYKIGKVLGADEREAVHHQSTN